MTIVNSQFDQVYLFFTWSKANGAIFFYFFLLKERIIRKCASGGVHVHFAYYTQARADLPIKQR